MYKEKLFVHSAGRREGLKIGLPCPIFNASFCKSSRLCKNVDYLRFFRRPCRKNSCKAGFLRAVALKRYLENGRGFRGRKKLLVAKVSSFP